MCTNGKSQQNRWADWGLKGLMAAVLGWFAVKVEQAAPHEQMVEMVRKVDRVGEKVDSLRDQVMQRLTRVETQVEAIRR